MPEPQQLKIRAASVTYTTAHSNAGLLTHWAWFLVRFVNHCAMTGTPQTPFNTWYYAIHIILCPDASFYIRYYSEYFTYINLLNPHNLMRQTLFLRQPAKLQFDTMFLQITPLHKCVSPEFPRLGVGSWRRYSGDSLWAQYFKEWDIWHSSRNSSEHYNSNLLGLIF